MVNASFDIVIFLLFILIVGFFAFYMQFLTIKHDNKKLTESIEKLTILLDKEQTK